MSEDPLPYAPADSETMSKVVSGALRFLLDKGRQGVEWSASEGKNQMEKRQLLKDRQAMWEKLGREVCALVEGGEVDHPGLRRGAERIRQIEAKIEAD
jgi:hypothetical protein